MTLEKHLNQLPKRLRIQTIVETSKEVLDTIQYIYQDTLLVAEIQREYVVQTRTIVCLQIENPYKLVSS